MRFLQYVIYTVSCFALLYCAMYVGITRDLCHRYDEFSTAKREAMQLTAQECAGYWRE